jgi:hypothetical protein
MSESGEQKRETRDRDRLLLFAFALGPLAALSNLAVCYTLVPTACARGSNTMLHASAAFFAILCLAAAFIGRHYHAQCGPSESLLWRERTRWLSFATIILGVSSFVVVVAMELPNVLLRSCQ